MDGEGLHCGREVKARNRLPRTNLRPPLGSWPEPGSGYGSKSVSDAQRVAAPWYDFKHVPSDKVLREVGRENAEQVRRRLEHLLARP